MKQPANIVVAIRNLAELLKSKTTETETLEVLITYSMDKGRWEKAHGLFDHIRSKNIKAQAQKNEALSAQFNFEESCAKTFYNLGRFSAPFDPDSAYLIVPRAIVACSYHGLDDQAVINAIMTEPGGSANSPSARG